MRCTETMIIVEVLRLHELLSYSLREIEKTTMCSKTTAGKIVKRCKEIGLDYETARTLSDKELKKLVFVEPVGRPVKKMPDYQQVHEKRKSSKKNLQYLWEELVQSEETDLGYSRFCYYYRQWKYAQGIGVYTPIERRPGEKLFIDWMGDTLKCVLDRETGELQKAYFFITTIGDSSYPYCEAFPNMNQFSWNSAHVNALQWYGALPKIFVPDNCRTAVSRARMWDPKLNRAYLEMAQYYQVAIEPARVRHPKGKASAEAGVRWLETWLLEWLKDYGHFNSFVELNQAIKERMKVLCNRNYTEQHRKEETRKSLFEKRDLPEMRRLPERPFPVYDFKQGTVPDYYHAQYASFYYSIPYRLFKKPYTLHAYQNTVHIFIGKDQVAVHERRYFGRRYVTNPDHMPEKDRFYLHMGEKDGLHYRRWASSYGEACRAVIESILNSYEYEPQGYKSCLGLLISGKKWGKEVLNAACSKALELHCASYTGVTRILKNQAQAITRSSCAHESVPPPHDLRTKEWKTLCSGGPL